MIKGLLRWVYPGLIAWCVAISGFAQDSTLTRFNDYRKKVIQEKVYLHVDRDVYLTGETMWLKAYAVDATTHRPLEISRVVYVEVVDRDNTPVAQEKIELRNGVGTGSVFLPASINSDTYLVRAYTAWMKNFSADYFFRKPVAIVNSFVKLETPPVTSANTTPDDVQFFPEGGNLLNGIVNKVGIKVNDAQGKGVNFRGAIVDQLNDTVARFQSHMFGMGAVDFTPVAGKSYRGVVHTSGKNASIVALAEAANEGFALRVEPTTDGIRATVSYMPYVESGPAVYLLAHTRHQLVKSERKSIAGGKAIFEIKNSELKDGITHLTVFDGRSRPVAERLYFRTPKRALQVSLKSGQEQFKPRTRVTLDVQTDVPAQQMSIAVYRLDSLLGMGQSAHINEYFNLTSDLKGLIESPGFYFSSDPAAVSAADHLMLTQGWRRFTWAEVSKGKPTFTFAPEFHGHLIRGVVKDLQGNASPGVLSYVSVPGKIIDVYTSRSDADGLVSFEMKHFVGGQKVLTVSDSAHRLELLNPFSSDRTAAKWPTLRVSPTIERNLLARSVGMQVQNVFYEDRYAPLSFDSTAFYGKADETYFLDDYTRFPVMEEVMREYVPGVMVRKQKGNFKFYLLDMVNKKPIYETPMILLDGVPVFDVNKIMSYDPLRVQKLEVVTRKFYHGMSTFPGIVSYTTYKGDLEGFELDPRYVFVNYEGIQQQREFYSPRHDYTREAETRLPDQRTLLYWNTTLSTEVGSVQNPQFFTSDVPGTYQVVVEGITQNGLSGFATYTFKVLK